jgi:serine/threonine-protein kinase
VTGLIDDRYQLLDIIASGGMATVWRARDTRLDRFVALKRPHPGATSDDSVRRRMDREARAASSLNHPNVVTVYDYGQDDDGPFLVMELADGPTLDQVAPELGEAEAIEIGARLAEALAAIHAVGIVHRDVKPANVIVSERGPLLTDFGIALNPGVTSMITDPGKIVVTPSYAAPEVLTGAAPTPAADVYALAVIVAELSNGHPLFSGFERPDAPPELRDARLARILGPALSPDPAERPSAAGLAAALGAAAPTISTPVATGDEGATLLMDVPVVAAATPPPSAPPSSRATGGRLMRWLMAALLVGALIFLLVTQGPAGEHDPAVGATPSLVPVTTTTVPPTTTTTVAPTTTTTPPTTTTTIPDEVTEARDRLEEVLLEPPRNDLSQAEAAEIMERVDEAIRLAGAGDQEQAEALLREVERDLDEGLRGGERRRAEDALEDLADLLGLSLRANDRGGDDDD